MSDVRVRFAPSPTGSFHIGSARTALFNWLYARHTGGTFVLRIEDTDKERNTQEALDHLLAGLRWLGMDWDEGPEVGGDYGPYFQSQRADIYKEYLEKLRASGHAYDKEGAVFFKVSGEPQIIEDCIRGNVERTEEKDFVIFRSNGTPVFHFVNVVDDMTMKITHIIRGEDHLSNSSKHVELFRAFGVQPPKFAHIPLILKTHGSGKMSKRDEGALIEEYQSRHFLPAAVRNFLCLLGWSPKDDREILSIEEIIQLFDLPMITKTNAHFDEKKMAFMNGEYVRMLSIPELLEISKPVFEKAGLLTEDITDDYLTQVLSVSQEKLKAIEDLPKFLDYFFHDEYHFDEKVHKKIFKKGDPIQRLTELEEALKNLEDFSEQNLEQTINLLAEQNNVGAGEYMLPARFAVSGVNVGPRFYGVLHVLGKDKVIWRLQRFINENAHLKA